MCCLLWQNFAKTAKRGFFCNDETLMATFHGEVVSVKVLLIVSIAVPIITIVLIEFIGKSRDNEKSFKIFNFAIAQKIVEASHYVSTFLFGFVINLLVTQMGKYLVARYRPHFLTSCQPVFPDGTNCSHAVNIGRNIDTFECSNPLLNDFEDLRRSWPSGHSSISFYSMIFLSVYIFMQKKDFLRELRLLKISTIFVFISFAWISSLSRIGDNKHHCELLKKILYLLIFYEILMSSTFQGLML